MQMATHLTSAREVLGSIRIGRQPLFTVYGTRRGLVSHVRVRTYVEKGCGGARVGSGLSHSVCAISSERHAFIYKIDKTLRIRLIISTMKLSCR